MSFNKTWYIIPYHIRKLPGMTLALLDFYETIFEFFNNGEKCFLSNKALMERTGIKSLTTIHEAFQYFEKHNVLKREIKNNRRYITRVSFVESEETGITEATKPVDNSVKNSSNIDRGTTGVGGGDTSAVGGGGTSGAAPNNNNINNKNLNKSSYASHDQKKNNEQKHEWANRTGEMKQVAKFWGPGHPDYDRLHPSKNVI